MGFGFDSHWLKNWRESFKPITKRSNRNHVFTFDSHLKTALNGSNKHSQYKPISQNDKEGGEVTEDGEVSEDSEDGDGEDEIIAVIESDSEDEDSHTEREDESDEMQAPQIYQGSVVTSRSGR